MNNYRSYRKIEIKKVSKGTQVTIEWVDVTPAGYGAKRRVVNRVEPVTSFYDAMQKLVRLVRRLVPIEEGKFSRCRVSCVDFKGESGELPILCFEYDLSAALTSTPFEGKTPVGAYYDVDDFNLFFNPLADEAGKYIDGINEVDLFTSEVDFENEDELLLLGNGVKQLTEGVKLLGDGSGDGELDVWDGIEDVN